MKLTGANFIRRVKMWVKEDGYVAPRLAADHLTSTNTDQKEERAYMKYQQAVGV